MYLELSNEVYRIRSTLLENKFTTKNIFPVSSLWPSYQTALYSDLQVEKEKKKQNKSQKTND